MKIRFILGITLLIIVSSCTIKNNKPPKLSTELTITEEIMYDNPDSALHILQNMPKPQESKKLEHATWALFMTQAKYKLYIAQSDSLLNIAYDYFINKNDAQRKALVLYYRAALLHEESKLEEAQALYLKAIDEIEETNDHRLAYLIYAGIGDIYAYRLSDYAFTYYNKAQESAYKSNDKKQIIASYISIARVYGKKKEYEKAIEYYNKSIELA